MTPLSRGIISSGKLGVVVPPSLFAANTADLDGATKSFSGGDILDSGTDDISAVCVFKGTGTAQVLISKQNSGDDDWWLVLLENSGKVRMDFRVDGSNFRTYETTASFNDGDWHTAIIFVDRSAGTITINVDGANQATTISASSGSITGNQNNSATLYIGRRDRTSGLFFTGRLGMTGAAFGVDLTADSTELYNGGNMPCWSSLSTGLKAKFTSNSGEFWELANWSGHVGQELTGQANSNTLTNNGSTEFTDTGLTVECGS